MKIILNLLLAIVPFVSISQDAFTLKMTTKGLENDSLIISAPTVSNGFESLYDFKIYNAFDLKNAGMVPVSGYFLKISGSDIYEGNVAYPIPVALIRLKSEGELPVQISSEFYLEAGSLTLKVPEFKNKVKLNATSASNLEYERLKLLLEPAYVIAKNPMQIDSLIDFSMKKDILGKYINENPNSYVALWEIVKDYPKYVEEGLDLSILEGFSNQLKESTLFSALIKMISLEKKSQIGDLFPETALGNDITFNVDYFKNHSLSLIDYWSSTCKPCLVSMPVLVDIYNRNVSKGLNIVGIVDDKDFERKEQVKRHLLKSKAEWHNYFDDADEFKVNVNAMGYPLYFLVDNSGVIIYRGSDLDEVNEILKEKFN